MQNKKKNVSFAGDKTRNDRHQLDRFFQSILSFHTALKVGKIVPDNFHSETDGKQNEGK